MEDFEKKLKKIEKELDTLSTSNGNGVNFCGVLTIVFIVLKLLGIISWSWWWVLSPIWLPFVIILGIAVIVFIIALIVGKE